jgi:polysaccharide deacetylase 2 family uncharacterized protein YibQ
MLVFSHDSRGVLRVATDDLDTPLGQHKAAKRRRTLPVPIPPVIAGGLGLFALVFAGWAMLADDPLGGEPMALVTADRGADNPAPAAEAAASQPAAPASVRVGEQPSRYDGPRTASGEPAASPPQTVPAGSKTITIIDGTSGKHRDVVVAGPGDGKSTALDERVTETSRHGPLPKIAADGARPSEIFARPVKAIAGRPTAPRVAIVVGGLGIGATATGDAIRKLPAPVTLVFGPYGGDLERQVARARDGGHEILLQAPMEPFDYPDNDPGPQTLLTSLDAAQNVDRLQWLMSRFQGYVGIAGVMGARFTASEQALGPVLRETAKRGLIYLDDGASTRSLASQISGANNLAFAKADLTIDSVPTAADVDRALARLETMARERGVAVGMANALPVSIERIAKWAKAAEGRGVLLVPITAVVAKAKSS